MRIFDFGLPSPSRDRDGIGRRSLLVHCMHMTSEFSTRVKTLLGIRAGPGISDYARLPSPGAKATGGQGFRNSNFKGKHGKNEFTIVNRQSSIKKVLVIAASAGGIDALTQVLSGLSDDFPAPILVVQHLRADRQTRLPEHLARHCPLKVRMAQNGMSLEAGVVYVAVPGQHLRIENGHMVLSSEEPSNYVRPSADVLFASAAESCGGNAIGIVLSGTGRDGAQGCQEIKTKGGITIAQNESTARYFAMPRTAINTGAIDYVLPVDEFAGKIMEIVTIDNCRLKIERL
jgi:two-component system chemotaxis response regulator CheB